jgi:hypothetical protein
VHAAFLGVKRHSTRAKRVGQNHAPLGQAIAGARRVESVRGVSRFTRRALVSRLALSVVVRCGASNRVRTQSCRCVWTSQGWLRLCWGRGATIRAVAEGSWERACRSPGLTDILKTCWIMTSPIWHSGGVGVTPPPEKIGKVVLGSGVCGRLWSQLCQAVVPCICGLENPSREHIIWDCPQPHKSARLTICKTHNIKAPQDEYGRELLVWIRPRGPVHDDWSVEESWRPCRARVVALLRRSWPREFARITASFRIVSLMLAWRRMLVLSMFGLLRRQRPGGCLLRSPDSLLYVRCSLCFGVALRFAGTGFSAVPSQCFVASGCFDVGAVVSRCFRVGPVAPGT